MDSFFPTIGAWLHTSQYALLFIATLFEGPVMMVSSGFLIRIGTMNFAPAYAVLVFGDFTADIWWYLVGRMGARPMVYRLGKFFGITTEAVRHIERRFLKYHEKILIISKLTMGFGFALVTLVVAGMMKVPFRNYVILNLLGGFVWTLMLVGVGFLFGNVYVSIPGSLKIIFAVVLLVGVYLFFRKGSRILATFDV